MKITIHTPVGDLQIDSKEGIDLSIPISRDGNTVNAYSIPAPSIEPLEIGSFIGSKAHGGPVNCENIRFNAHGNGTHTECYGHISNPEKVYLLDCLKEFWFKAQVFDVKPEKQGDDFIIGLTQIKDKIEKGVDAIIIRNLPNDKEKLIRQYSGTNPVYFTPEFMEYVVANKIKHFLTDLPSVDREEDQGALVCHHIFWGYPDSLRKGSTISELLFIPDHVKEAVYVLNLMVSGFDSDAVPSIPTIYPIK